MFYLVFSLDENACEQYWKCFTSKVHAKQYLRDSYNEMLDSVLKICDGHSVYGCLDKNLYHAIIRFGGECMTEFFLVEISESKVLSEMAI